RLLIGKFVGGCLTLAVPLLLGFAIAGVVIGLTAHDSSIGSFLRLAFSGLALGIVFLALGLLISTFSRTRVQALVLALLTWCMAIFVFDLIALACLVSTKSPAASHEIEIICDATHVNAATDFHSAFDSEGGHRRAATESDSKSGTAGVRLTPSLAWVALNP